MASLAGRYDEEFPVRSSDIVLTLSDPGTVRQIVREMAPNAWQDRIPSALMACFTGAGTAPSPVSRKAPQLPNS